MNVVARGVIINIDWYLVVKDILQCDRSGHQNLRLKGMLLVNMLEWADWMDKVLSKVKAIDQLKVGYKPVVAAAFAFLSWHSTHKGAYKHLFTELVNQHGILWRTSRML